MLTVSELFIYPIKSLGGIAVSSAMVTERGLQYDRRWMLVYEPDAVERRVDTRYATDKEIVSFADGYPMLLIGQSSLDDLNSRLQENLSIRRFRPNIVFTGGEPFEEDGLEAFKIKDILFYGLKLCARCCI